MACTFDTAHLLDHILLVHVLGLVPRVRVQGCLHLGLDFLTERRHEFDVDIGLQQCRSDFFKRGIENLSRTFIASAECEQ